MRAREAVRAFDVAAAGCAACFDVVESRARRGAVPVALAVRAPRIEHGRHGAPPAGSALREAILRAEHEGRGRPRRRRTARRGGRRFRRIRSRLGARAAPPHEAGATGPSGRTHGDPAHDDAAGSPAENAAAFRSRAADASAARSNAYGASSPCSDLRASVANTSGLRAVARTRGGDDGGHRSRRRGPSRARQRDEARGAGRPSLRGRQKAPSAALSPAGSNGPAASSERAMHRSATPEATHRAAVAAHSRDARRCALPAKRIATAPRPRRTPRRVHSCAADAGSSRQGEGTDGP